MTALSWKMVELLVLSSNQLNVRPKEITLFAGLELHHVYRMYITPIYNVYAMYITHKYNLNAMYITYAGIHIYEPPKAHIPEFSAILSVWL